MAAVAVILLVPFTVQAYEIPEQNTNIKYFSVFGPEGDPDKGAEKDNTQVLYFDVPASASQDLVLEVYDPDTTGHADSRSSFKWDTATSITVEGSGVLDQVTIPVGDSMYDNDYLKFGPYPKEKGKKVGDVYRFRLIVKGIEGNDQNLFSVRVSPESVVSFADMITFRLASGTGKKKYFYPGVSASTTGLTIKNYDLDPMGGTSVLVDNASNQEYKVNDSDSGQWADTQIALQAQSERKLVYVITRGRQIGANAGLKILDQNGQPLPIYFHGPEPVKAAPPPEPAPAPAPAPVLACNRFVFDATQSYDPNNDKITYLWDFGDGQTSTEPVVAHQFGAGGTYKVTLTVSDNSGLNCETAVTSQTVDVNTPPVAALEGPERDCTGSAVVFNASATKDDQPANLKYTWSFGDGTYGEGATVKKVYDKGGVYDVVLTVDDQSGSKCATDSISQKIRINGAPVANAGEDVTLYLKNASAPYSVAFDGSASSDPNGDELTYLWQFGDGASADGKKVEHTYAKPGDYTARLTVNDQSGLPCSADSDSVNIKLNKAPIADAGAPQYVCSGNEVTLDASGSSGEEGETLTYAWDLGDGTTAEGVKVTHRYKTGGDYQVMLTVDDGRGTPVSQTVSGVSVRVNSTPIARLEKVGTSCAGDKVKLDASASSDADGDKLKYSWDFGDGTKEEGGSAVTHQYTKGGNYKVVVRVDDGRGSSCSVSTASVRVPVNTPPVADAGPNLVCCQEDQSAFDGSASSDPDGNTLSYNWDFGDGQTGQGAKVTHVYDKSGVYQVRLTVDDNSGTACSAAVSGFTANVNAKPVPMILVKQD